MRRTFAAVCGRKPRVAVLGFGEAGAEFARDLVALGADVRGFDPNITAPQGVSQREDDADAVWDAELVFSLTTGARALEAVRAALPALRPGTVWAEANTATPALKLQLAALVQSVGGDLVDVAIMTPVHGAGLRAPMAASGPGAALFAAAMADLGVPVEEVTGPVGAASTRKLLRGVVYKGLTAAVLEAMAGATAAGCAEWFHRHLTAEFMRFDGTLIEELIAGAHVHAACRSNEMEAAALQLVELGITPHIAAATRDVLRVMAETRMRAQLGAVSGEMSNPGCPVAGSRAPARRAALRHSDGTPVTVLVVDDEPTLAELLAMALRYEGWDVVTAADGRKAVVQARNSRPDVVVLDLMLPDMTGLEVLGKLRRDNPRLPVLMLTAKDSVEDRIAGLTAGGDDYVTKPFSIEEVVLRLRALLRRTGVAVEDSGAQIVVGELTLDEDSREVTRAGEPVMLTSTEFELLRFFMRNPRRVLSKAQILDRVWSYDFGGRSNIVELYVSYLRKKIDLGREPMLHTVRGAGYVLKPTGLQ